MSRSWTIQGRQLFSSDIDLVRRMIADHPHWHRTRLSRELCKLWQWYTDKGLLKDMACRTLLRKLEQKGLIVLPKAHNGGPGKRKIPDVPHRCDSIDAKLNTVRPVQTIPVYGRGKDNELFHCLLDRYHYLGCRGTVGEHMKYLVFDSRQRPLACILFGSAAWKTAPRDLYVGWDRITRKQNLRFITNNSRFLILPWVRVPNLASFILGQCMNRLREDWHAKYGHDLFLVETFVARTRFKGTCYRAANWIKIGQTKGRSRQDRHHSVQVPVKDIYVYPLTQDFRKRLCSQL